MWSCLQLTLRVRTADSSHAGDWLASRYESPVEVLVGELGNTKWTTTKRRLHCIMHHVEEPCVLSLHHRRCWLIHRRSVGGLSTRRGDWMSSLSCMNDIPFSSSSSPSGACTLVVVVAACRLSLAERKKEERKTWLMVCFFGIAFALDENAVYINVLWIGLLGGSLSYRKRVLALALWHQWQRHSIS